MPGSEEDFRLAHPRTAELVIEVCVTSAEYDRSKLRACATAGVKKFGWFWGAKSKSRFTASRAWVNLLSARSTAPAQA